MKINSVNQQPYRQNFSGSLIEKTVGKVLEHPSAIATLAGSSVVAQKLVMGGSEAVVGPAMDIAIGKTITKIADEKDDRTNQSSRVQAIRTFAQSTGGTIIGIAIRAICIGLATYGFSKFASKATGEMADIINKTKIAKGSNKFIDEQNAQAWGKNIGGALATIVMLGTNFVIDAPFINMINKKTTTMLDKSKTEETQPKPQIKEQAGEVK